MSDDDLRFGDVDSGGNRGEGGGTNIVESIISLFVAVFIGLIMLYIILATVEILFNIPIPYVA